MPMNLRDYHPDWRSISRQIREQAGQQCEGTPRFPDCVAVNSEPHPETGSRVVLTVAHMDHDRTNNDPANLRALCQRCHLDWDRDHHLRNRRRTMWEKKLGGQANEADGLPF
ncbi:MAG: hypothetical protein LC131_15105 [Anaerolineae bacterium]|nr:hypothetical protein [Anaerolineae bacterium]